MVEREEYCHDEDSGFPEPLHMAGKVPPEKQFLGDGTHKPIEHEVVHIGDDH